MHRVVIEPDQSVTLYVGAENWPMPISIVKNGNGAWYFDTETGKKEVLYRRIGTNENDAIDVKASPTANVVNQNGLVWEVTSYHIFQ
jgi:hypothetical protein